MSTKQELFTKVTGLTFNPDKITDPVKLAWLIPDGAMLESKSGRRYEMTQEFMEEAGLPIDGKVTTIVESTANNENPKTKPAGKGWKKVVDAEAYTEDPSYIESIEYDYVYDEASWNASEASGALSKYHAKYPEEDWWNNTANRACNYNDRIYLGTLVEAEASANVSATVAWASEAAQKITIDGVDYFGAIFYGFEPQDVVLFNDVALTEAADKTLQISSISYSSDCGRSWAGALNAPGAQYPWVCPNFTTDVNGTVIFRYEGADDVKPWDDKVFHAGDWGCESVAKLFGDDFDIAKFTMVIEVPGAVHEEEYHWERTV
jgi:hypothetical protein